MSSIAEEQNIRVMAYRGISMRCIQGTRTFFARWGVALAMASGSAVVAGPALAASASGKTPGEAALQALIEQAKKEPNAINGSMTRVLLGTPALIKKANQMFNQRFGLNKTINIVEGTDNTFTTQMMASLDMGGSARLAFYTTNGSDIPSFIDGKYVLQIKDWQLLLTEINPRVKSGAVKPTDISRAGYEGYAFAHSNRLKAVGYNKETGSPDNLPRTYEEMADPKYKGQYAIEPWLSHWQALGYNYYPDRLDQALKIYDAIGKNAYVVGRSHQLNPRMAQGEFKFMTLNAEVVADFVARNPGAPLDFYFMNDMTLVETTMMFVPSKGPAPATGTLWVMYLSDPDIQALRGPDAPNVMYGELENDKRMIKRLEGKKIFDWKLNESTNTYWQWVNSDAAKDFRAKMTAAILQRK
jgi:ABC-type Fe3+ transport system substrate-binding protein